MKGLTIVLSLALALVAGCNKPVEGRPDEVATAVHSEDSFLSGFDGVWATTSSAGTDDAETVYRLRFAKNGSDLVMDNHVFDVHVIDVDTVNQTVTFQTSGETGPQEMLTVARVVEAKDRGNPEAPFTLRITFGNGQFSDLSFVRRLMPQDVQFIAEARQSLSADSEETAEVSQPVETPESCADQTSFIERTTCKDPALKEARAGFESAFGDAVMAHGQEAGISMKAAQRQLDACASTECLQKTYAEWTKCVHENYPVHATDAE